MSGKAATEISTIVKGSVKDAQEIATENKEKVERGNNLVLSASEVLKEIQVNSEHTMAGSSQIVSASREQTNGIRQINKAMDTLNQTTQQTAAHSEEAASAGEELTSQADSLNQMVSELNSVIYGLDRVNESFERGEHKRTSKKETAGAHSGTNVTVMDFKRKSVRAAANPNESIPSEPLKKAAGMESHGADSSGGDAWEKL